MSTDAGNSTLSESLSYDHVPIAPLIFLSEAWARVRGQYWLMVGISLVGLLLGSLAPFGLLMGPMMFGIFFCHRTLALGQPVSFEMLFKGFEHFLETFIATLLMIAASLVVVVPLIFIMVVSMFGLGFLSAASAQAHDHAQEGAVIVMVLLFVGIFLLIMAGSLLVGLLFAFTFPLMVDRGLKGMDAVKLSFRASRAPTSGACWASTWCCWCSAWWASVSATWAPSSSSPSRSALTGSPTSGFSGERRRIEIEVDAPAFDHDLAS